MKITEQCRFSAVLADTSTQYLCNMICTLYLPILAQYFCNICMGSFINLSEPFKMYKKNFKNNYIHFRTHQLIWGLLTAFLRQFKKFQYLSEPFLSCYRTFFLPLSISFCPFEACQNHSEPQKVFMIFNHLSECFTTSLYMFLPFQTFQDLSWPFRFF